MMAGICKEIYSLAFNQATTVRGAGALQVDDRAIGGVRYSATGNAGKVYRSTLLFGCILPFSQVET